MRKLTIFLLFTLCAVCVEAGVNIKNGNFYISYTDISFSDDFQITRTYNSKSTYQGIFGYGWGSEYETRLLINGDGTITLRNHGGGGTDQFYPSNFQLVDIDSMIDTLMQVEKQLGTFVDAMGERNLRDYYRTNREIRNVKWQNYVTNQLLAPHSLAVGIALSNERNGGDIILVTEYGFVRNRSSETQRFDRQGLLVRTTTNSGEFVHIRRNSKGHVRGLYNHLDHSIQFETDDNGRVLKAVASNGKQSSYRYDGNDLVLGEDAAGNRYTYQYDNNHNMTQIGYDDGSTMDMTYTPAESYVASITSRNGDVTSYEYFSEDIASLENPVHKYGRIIDRYGTNITKLGFNNKPVTNVYLYEISTNATGKTWTSAIETRINGVETVTQYHPCGSPIRILRGNRETVFDYNDDCNLIHKNDGTTITDITFDAKHKKISRVRQTGVDGKAISDSKFDYDDMGNLVYSTNSSGKVARLEYGNDGRIARMEDEQKQVLLFEYNAIGKPIKIMMPSVGVVNVTYDDMGEILKVESPQGHQMALKITQMFQNLLTLVKPAGVNLNM